MEKQTATINGFNEAPVRHPRFRAFRTWWHTGRHAFYTIIGLIVIILLAWLLWHRQMADALHSIFGGDEPSISAKADFDSTAKKSLSPESTSANDTDPDVSTKPSNGTSSRTSTDSTTTRNNGTTVTTTTTTTSGTPASPSNPSSPPSTNTDTSSQDSHILTLAANARPGMTKVQLVNLAGGMNPTSCTDVTLSSVVQQSTCTWTSAAKSVTVTLQNGVEVGAATRVGV